MRFLWTIAATILAAGCASAAKPVDAPEDSAVRSPNVVIILADDMGYGDIGANGASLISTPNIDKLARDGVNFTQFYASANVCSPSRAGLMTGRYPIRTSLGYNVLSAMDERGLPESEETLAELAARAGYASMLIGKWHLGRLPEYSPLRHGFDEFYGVPHSNDMPDFALYRGDDVIERPVEQATLTKRYTEEAVSFIARNASRPFLLFVSHTMPHIPLFASDEFEGSSDAGLYGDVIEELDASVGAIVAALERAGARDNTLIMITSDNGPFFEGGVAGLKGGKGNGWEGAYRVPLIVNWPAGVAAQGDNAAIAMNIDILPTVGDVIGAAPEADVIDGRSLLANFRGDQNSPHDYLLYFNNEDVIGVRTQAWKFLTHAYYRRSLGAFEKFDQLDGFSSSYDLLFDASRPGGEEYSYAARHPDVVKEMKKTLGEVRAEFDRFRTHSPDVTFPE